jgi:hypothetical protein
MALLSAHSEHTSDAQYGNHAESMVFNMSGRDMDKYRLCARLFNDMVGITVPRESTPCRYTAGSMPTPPTKSRRVQTPPCTELLSQTTSGGFQWPPTCCGSLTAIDENASSVDYVGDVGVQTPPCTELSSQTTSGGFQWPPTCCGSLTAVDENASSVDYDGDVDLLWADLNQGLDDDKAAGKKRDVLDACCEPATAQLQRLGCYGVNTKGWR